MACQSVSSDLISLMHYPDNVPIAPLHLYTFIQSKRRLRHPGVGGAATKKPHLKGAVTRMIAEMQSCQPEAANSHTSPTVSNVYTTCVRMSTKIIVKVAFCVLGYFSNGSSMSYHLEKHNLEFIS